MISRRTRALGARDRTRRRPPERIVHIGLGAFHRSHQAWYTHAAPDADEWGIVAYGGRRAELAETLSRQDGLYTLVVRGPHGDRFETLESIVRAEPGSRADLLVRDVAAPATAIVTLTITEAGYHLDAAGGLETSSPPVADDLVLLASEDRTPGRWPQTPLARLVLGLDERRRNGGAGLAVVSCDNVPRNGELTRAAVLGYAAAISPDLGAWIDDEVSFVSSSVDRITPRLLPDDIRVVEEATGRSDGAPVVTEPFSDWVLEGAFPGGRPSWEDAGARVVDDVGPWESRKLWMLNGAHSLLALRGQLEGAQTVAEAIADGGTRSAVDAFWRDAERTLPAGLDVARYRAALVERFENPRIVHALSQIAQDSVTKLRVRVVPVIRRCVEGGVVPTGCALVLAAWIDACARGIPGAGADRPEVSAALREGSVEAMLAALDTSVASPEIVASTRAALRGAGADRPA